MYKIFTFGYKYYLSTIVSFFILFFIQACTEPFSHNKNRWCIKEVTTVIFMHLCKKTFGSDIRDSNTVIVMSACIVVGRP